MTEDKLTHPQRVRLEALTQTIAGGLVHLHTADPRPGLGELFTAAEAVEDWLHEAVDLSRPGPAPALAGGNRLAHVNLGTSVVDLCTDEVVEVAGERAHVDAVAYVHGTEVVVTLSDVAPATPTAEVLLTASKSLARLAERVHEQATAPGRVAPFRARHTSEDGGTP